jgi:hypothetical protein
LKVVEAVLVTIALLSVAPRSRAEGPASVSPEVAAGKGAPPGPEAPPPGFTIGPKPAWFLAGGVTSGDTLVAHDRGGYVGGEISLVRLQRGRFLGLYGDGYYDVGASRTYATGGVELGYKFFGIDAGAAARFGQDGADWGPTGRIFVTVGIVSIYGRYAYFPGSALAGNEHVVQVGGLFKLPFAAWGGR